jgi:hypothetical protein
MITTDGIESEGSGINIKNLKYVWLAFIHLSGRHGFPPISGPENLGRDGPKTLRI